MEFEDRLKSLNDMGVSGRYMTEAFILNLLRKYIENQGKEFVENLKVSSYLTDKVTKTIAFFDAFAPEGFDDFAEPTYIEVTSSVSFEKLDSLGDMFERVVSDGLPARLLILVTKSYDEEFLTRCRDYFDALNIAVSIWGVNRIQAIADSLVDDVNEIGNKLFHLRLESAFNKDSEDWKDKRDDVIRDVSTSYGTGQFSLFLGAGVSSSAGLPDWDTLLNSLFVSLLTSELDQHRKIEKAEISSIVKRLRDVDEPSALMSARYIRKGMSSSGSVEQNTFINEVTEQLYSLRDQRFSLESPLIKSIADMCMPGRTGAKVKSVITYNFDDLVERQLNNKGVVHKSIFEEVEVPSPEELPVYHVHGYLPEDRSAYNNLDRSTLVFSEEGYHKIYGDSYHWSNLVQLNNLKESTCMMIGLSLTDPNLRRLLEISARSIEKPKHYAFMQRIDIDYFSKEGSKKIVNAPLSTIKTFLDRHHILNEEVLKELGVNVIWYESYDEIPRIINKIHRYS
ncbi:SIR2 family protein [Amphritea sp. HPY]|uniref:SIR2 family protein n=1 Tax=Amphritea sp. HPY TaxID=3421652 RepID=UPI003D7E4E09